MTTKERIISTYHQLDSIKETSRVLRISEQSVRRILVNAGEYSNSRSQEIADLVAEGKSKEEIAEILHISRNTVQAYLPYSRSPYIINDRERTENALRIKRWREEKERLKKRERPMGVKNFRELEFAVSCIESVAQTLGMNADQVYQAFTKKSDIINGYLIPKYETLRTQSRDDIIAALLDVMKKQGVL